jgi:ribosomal protein RSM22 (predicted rRNA methylase)
MPIYNLPKSIQDATEQLVSKISLKELISARQGILEKYLLSSESNLTALSYTEKLSYLLSRAGATYAATLRLLEDAISYEPIISKISHWRDLGSGPGTASWALSTLLSSELQIEAVETDAQWIEISQAIAQHLSLIAPAAFAPLVYQKLDLLEHSKILPPTQGTIAAYFFNEIFRQSSQEKALLLLERVWSSTTEVLIIVEPGTPTAFEAVNAMRSHLLSLGAHLLAPCPHHHNCPAAAQGDWCHFAARSARSALSRRVKEATEPYEDEKYCYLVASKTPSTAPPHSRILRHPHKRKGLVQLEACHHSGTLEDLNVSQRHRDSYRLAREISWGDRWSSEN